MSRPWHIWLAFGACLGLVLAAMGWISLTVIRLDRSEQNARTQSQREENARLALWRMDSALAPIAAQESARPYFAYGSFYSANRPYGNMFNDNTKPGEVLLPSPLLTQAGPNALLHFQIDENGNFTSPQVPTGNKVDLALSSCSTHELVNIGSQRLSVLRGAANRQTLLALTPEPPDIPARSLVDSNDAQQQGRLVQGLDKDNYFQQAMQAQQQKKQQQAEGQNDYQQLDTPQQQGGKLAANQSDKNRVEFQKRAQSYQGQVQSIQNNVDWAANNGPNPTNFIPASLEVREGAMKAAWVRDNLVLVRRVIVNGKTYVQGCWLDWASIRTWLLEDIGDLLPSATLEPVLAENGDRTEYRLAALPARLVPGTFMATSYQSWSPIQISLVIAWICVLLGAAAVAALLLGAVTLSERRGAFVSAVTHELRTPLTTFRMYTEMLAGGMVTDEEKRNKYLTTLRVEAERLSHLVENVLSFAKLERGAKGTRLESIALRDVVERTRQRLSDRAEQAGMQVVIDPSVTKFDALAHTDPSAIEQILFNLVDNACKYAAQAESRTILISAEHIGKNVALRVSDHGPGLSKTERKRLFRPFSKSASDAAHSAPGVGLGLALSRRLARDMGGDLRLDSAEGTGASFVLIMTATGQSRPATGEADAQGAAHA